jgi:hypothetical protein
MTSLARKKSSYCFVFFNPTVVILLWASMLVLVSVHLLGGDPIALVRLGTRYSAGYLQGTQGYDGQFVYYIAQELDPQQVASKLDVPAYRYQRILLPLLAHLFSLGNQTVLLWMLPILGIISLAVGTWALSVLFEGWGISRWYALVYGLYPGFSLALVVDLPEPLAYSLVISGILAVECGKKTFGWFLLALAVFAKEVTLLFVVAIFLAELLQRDWRDVLGIFFIVLSPYILFQVWMYSQFGTFGIGAGGEMATPFEWIPFMGLLRIGAYSQFYLLAMILVFGPSVVLPVIWGLWSSLNSIRIGQRNMIVLGLLINSLVILFLPFSTFRETGGLLRFASGLILALLLYAGRYKKHRVLNYSIFLFVLNVFLIKPPEA